MNDLISKDDPIVTGIVKKMYTTEPDPSDRAKGQPVDELESVALDLLQRMGEVGMVPISIRVALRNKIQYLAQQVREGDAASVPKESLPGHRTEMQVEGFL